MKVAEDLYEDENESSEDDEDEIAHLGRRILKAWINRKKKKCFVLKKNKKGKPKHGEVICFECKEPGHVRSECPRLKKNLKKKGSQEEIYDGNLGRS